MPGKFSIQAAAISLLLGACAGNFDAKSAGGIPSTGPQGDNRLMQALAKLHRGESISVVALGGSITTGYQASPPASAGWAGRVNGWLQEKARETGGAVEYRNSGASGTDSAFASIRVQDHVLAYNPDIVIVEFAVNDQWLGGNVRRRSFEGVLRQLLAGSQRSVIILSLNEKSKPDKSTFREQDQIGRHYGIPVLAWDNWAKVSDYEKGFTGSETIHPNNDGHSSIAAGIISYLAAAWDSLPKTIPAVNATPLPDALVSAEFQNVTLIGSGDVGAIISNSLWEAQPAILPNEWNSRGSQRLNGWTTSDPKAELAVRITGKSAGLLFAESDQFCNALAWIEDPEGKTEFKKVIIRNYVSYRNGYYGHAYAEIADNLDRSKEYVLRIAVNPVGRQGADGARASTHIIGVICTGSSVAESANPQDAVNE